jgi:hypothetical protein
MWLVSVDLWNAVHAFETWCIHMADQETRLRSWAVTPLEDGNQGARHCMKDHHLPAQIPGPRPPVRLPSFTGLLATFPCALTPCTTLQKVSTEHEKID